MTLTDKQSRVLNALRRLTKEREADTFASYEIAHEAEVDNRGVGRVLHSLMLRGRVAGLYDSKLREYHWSLRAVDDAEQR
jgi:hypothetical protein